MKTIKTGTIIHRDNKCPHGETGECYLCLQALKDWTENFIKSQKDLPPEIQAIVNKNFWDLLA